MWELDHKEGWVLKNWCFQTVVLEKTLESPLDSKEIKPVNPKVNKPWILIGRTDAKAEASILWPPDVKTNSREDSDAGKDWGQEEKRGTEYETVRIWGITDSMDMSLSKFQEIMKDRKAWHATVHGVSKYWIWLSNWTTTTILFIFYLLIIANYIWCLNLLRVLSCL